MAPNNEKPTNKDRKINKKFSGVEAVPAWVGKVLPNFERFGLNTQKKILKTLLVLGFSVVQVADSKVNPPVELGIVESFPAQVMEGHGQVLKLKDGTMCVITNAHVENTLPNSEAATPLEISDVSRYEKEVPNVDLQLIQVGDQYRFVCSEAFAQEISFKTNIDLQEFLESKPKLSMQTSLVYESVSSKKNTLEEQSDAPKSLINRDYIQSRDISNYLFSPDLNLIFYTLPAGQSTMSGTSGSPLIAKVEGRDVVVGLHAASYPLFNPQVYNLFFQQGQPEELAQTILMIGKALESGEVIEDGFNVDGGMLDAQFENLVLNLAQTAIRNPEIIRYIQNKDILALYQTFYEDTIISRLQAAEANRREQHSGKNPETFQKAVDQNISTAQFLVKNRRFFQDVFLQGESLSQGVPVTGENLAQLKNEDSEK